MSKYSRKMESAFCSRLCPLITSAIFVGIAAIFTIISSLGMSSSKGTIQSVPWMVHDSESDIEYCPNGDPILTRGNLDQWGNFWGVCTQIKTLDNEKFGRVFCQSWDNVVATRNNLPNLEYPGEYCKSNDAQNELDRSEFGSAACRSAKARKTNSALAIVGCIFTWFYLFTLIVRMFRDSQKAKIGGIINGIIALCFVMASLIFYPVENYPRQDDQPSVTCPEIVVKVTYYLSVGWILQFLSTFIVASCVVITTVVPTEEFDWGTSVAGRSDVARSGATL